MDKKSKNLLIMAIVISSIIVIGIAVYLNVDVQVNNQIEISNEIVPEEEISDEQLRETVVNLYFVNNDNEIAEETRKVDSKTLIQNPYREVMTLLLGGPKSESLKTTISKNTKINDIEKVGECLVIDFSKEFIEEEEDDVEIQSLTISQIVNTMTQFTEINSVKILIDGQENMSFNNGNIKFEQLFTNED